MEINSYPQFQPRADPDGQYERECSNKNPPHTFRTNSLTALYCSERCKKAEHNRRNYQRHRRQRRAKMRKYMRIMRRRHKAQQ